MNGVYELRINTNVRMVVATYYTSICVCMNRVFLTKFLDTNNYLITHLP